VADTDELIGADEHVLAKVAEPGISEQFMDSPGNDLESIAAQVAAEALQGYAQAVDNLDALAPVVQTEGGSSGVMHNKALFVVVRFQYPHEAVERFPCPIALSAQYHYVTM
jgi:hypothetical protein